ncbi:MAG: hypothetical protein K5868_08940 [Lachnospiraceae bacterium]|nr:hypothetical protein [Lachnospiraceae bacterium]
MSYKDVTDKKRENKSGEASWNAYIKHHWYFGDSPSERDEYTSLDLLHDAVRKGHPEAIVEYKYIVREIEHGYLLSASFGGIFLGFLLYLIVGSIIAGINGTHISPATYFIFYFVSILIIYLIKKHRKSDPWIMQ